MQKQVLVTQKTFTYMWQVNFLKKEILAIPHNI